MTIQHIESLVVGAGQAGPPQATTCNAWVGPS